MTPCCLQNFPGVIYVPGHIVWAVLSSDRWSESVPGTQRLAAWRSKCFSLRAHKREINDGLLWMGNTPKPDACKSQNHKLHVAGAQGKTENYLSK